MTAKEFYEANATNVCHVPRNEKDKGGWNGVRRAEEARFIAGDVPAMPLWDVFDFAEKYSKAESGRVEEQRVICVHDIPLNQPCAQCFRGDYQPFADWWQSLSQDQRTKFWPHIDSLRFAYKEGLIHGKASHSQPSVKEKL